MGRPITPADLFAGKARWLLEVDWDGLVHRWTDAIPDGPLVLTDADGNEYTYRGGLDLGHREDLNFLGESNAPPSISLDLWLDKTQEVQTRLRDGHDLSTMTATLYRWTPGMTYEDRDGRFHGVAREPAWGGPNEPVSVTFESPLFREGSRWVEGRIDVDHLDADEDLATGDPYPIIFGAPGNPSAPGASYQVAGSPALQYDATNRRFVAGVVLGGAAVVGLWNTDPSGLQGSSSLAVLDNQGVSFVRITADAMGFVADADYAVEWSGEDVGAGAMLEHAGAASPIRVDRARLSGTAGLLNGFKVSGYIDAEVSAWDWATRNLVTLLPASASYSAQGAYVQAWDPYATRRDAVASLTAGEGLVRIGAIQTESTQPINEVVVRYAPDFDREPTKTITVTGRPVRNRTAATVVTSAKATASRIRLADLDGEGPQAGVRTKNIETPFVWESATALAIALWYIEAFADGIRSVIYEDTAHELEWLQVGDHILLTDAELAYAERLMLVRGIRWEGARFFLDLIFKD